MPALAPVLRAELWVCVCGEVEAEGVDVDVGEGAGEAELIVDNRAVAVEEAEGVGVDVGEAELLVDNRAVAVEEALLRLADVDVGVELVVTPTPAEAVLVGVDEDCPAVSEYVKQISDAAESARSASSKSHAETTHGEAALEIAEKAVPHRQPRSSLAQPAADAADKIHEVCFKQLVRQFISL